MSPPVMSYVPVSVSVHEVSIPMASTVFLKGLRHELANRAFARLAIGRMAQRFAGQAPGLFWGAYLELEVFNEPRYAAAARCWGLSTEAGLLTRLKALVVSSVPTALHRSLLRLVHHETLKYFAWLQGLRGQGPADAQGFLDYMVAQERVQLEMMQMALAGLYAESAAHARAFFLEHGGEHSTGLVEAAGGAAR